MRIFPRDDDRSWTREFYYAINRVVRRIEYDHRSVQEAKPREKVQEKHGYTTFIRDAVHAEMDRRTTSGERKRG